MQIFMDTWKLFNPELNTFNNVLQVFKRSSHDIGTYCPLFKDRKTLQQVL